MATMKSPSANPGCPGRGSTDWTRMPQSSSKRRSSALRRYRKRPTRKANKKRHNLQIDQKVCFLNLDIQYHSISFTIIPYHSLSFNIIQCVKGSKPVLPGSKCQQVSVGSPSMESIWKHIWKYNKEIQNTMEFRYHECHVCHASTK